MTKNEKLPIVRYVAMELDAFAALDEASVSEWVSASE
jgi:hypothetical protein